MAADVAAAVTERFASEILAPLVTDAPAEERIRQVGRNLDAFYEGGDRRCLLDVLSVGHPGDAASAALADAGNGWVGVFAAVARDAGASPQGRRRPGAGRHRRHRGSAGARPRHRRHGAVRPRHRPPPRPAARANALTRAGAHERLRCPPPSVPIVPSNQGEAAHGALPRPRVRRRRRSRARRRAARERPTTRWRASRRPSGSVPTRWRS